MARNRNKVLAGTGSSTEIKAVITLASRSCPTGAQVLRTAVGVKDLTL